MKALLKEALRLMEKVVKDEHDTYKEVDEQKLSWIKHAQSFLKRKKNQKTNQALNDRVIVWMDKSYTITTVTSDQPHEVIIIDEQRLIKGHQKDLELFRTDVGTDVCDEIIRQAEMIIKGEYDIDPILDRDLVPKDEEPVQHSVTTSNGIVLNFNVAETMRRDWDFRENKNMSVAEYAKQWNVGSGTMAKILRRQAYTDPNYVPPTKNVTNASGVVLNYELAEAIRKEWAEEKVKYNGMTVRSFSKKWKVSSSAMGRLLNRRSYTVPSPTPSQVTPPPPVPLPDLITKQPLGENDTRTKNGLTLNYEVAEHIRAEWEKIKSGTSRTVFAKKWGIGKSTMGRLLNRETHSTPPPDVPSEENQNQNQASEDLKTYMQNRTSNYFDHEVEEQLREEFKKRKSVEPEWTITDHAAEYNVSQSTMSRIVNRTQQENAPSTETVKTASKFLSAENVEKIKAEWKHLTETGQKTSKAAFGRKWGVADTTIGRIVRGKTHV